MTTYELTGAFDPLTLTRPGIYLARSDSGAYGPLLAAITLGLAEDMGENIEPRGVKIQAARVKGRGKARRKNPTIGIGREFFVTALNDYSDWKQTWWREVVQNSVDAGSTLIELSCTENPDGTWTISATDNGGGMDEDVLLNKFLLLGGTTKVGAEGKAGGFGKAKELLILPWLRWTVHSQDTVASGTGIDYTVERGSYLNGTKVEVVMPADQHTDAPAAIAFIEKCDLPGVRFRVTQFDQYGEQRWTPKAKLKAKNELVEIPGKAIIYTTKVKGRKPWHMYIRVKGIYMFEEYVGETPGEQVIVEITAPSIEILTANRYGFRDREVRREVSRLATRIAKNTQSAFETKQGIFKKKYEGGGKFRAERKAAEASALAEIGPIAATRGGKTKIKAEDLVEVSEAVEEYREREDQAEVAKRGPQAGLPDRDLSKALLSSVEFKGAHHVEEAVRQLVWEPDFYLINKIEGFKVPKKFKPETMAPRVTKLVKVWTELCRFVLMQLGSFREFGVGLIFSEGTAAAAVYEGGENWLLLNPYKDVKTRKTVWSPTKAGDLKWLYAAAVHECTHMADGVYDHDEAFSSALTMNIARTADGFKKVRGIVNSVKMITPEKSEVSTKNIELDPGEVLVKLTDAQIRALESVPYFQADAPNRRVPGGLVFVDSDAVGNAYYFAAEGANPDRSDLSAAQRRAAEAAMKKLKHAYQFGGVEAERER